MNPIDRNRWFCAEHVRLLKEWYGEEQVNELLEWAVDCAPPFAWACQRYADYRRRIEAHEDTHGQTPQTEPIKTAQRSLLS